MNSLPPGTSVQSIPVPSGPGRALSGTLTNLTTAVTDRAFRGSAWTTLQTMTLDGSGLANFNFDAAAAGSRRFYRVVAL